MYIRMTLFHAVSKYHVGKCVDAVSTCKCSERRPTLFQSAECAEYGDSYFGCLYGDSGLIIEQASASWTW